MSLPRRRILRSAAPAIRLQPDRRRQRLRARLEAERVALARWQTKLRRAFTTVEKLQKSIARVEKQIACLEE